MDKNRNIRVRKNDNQYQFCLSIEKVKHTWVESFILGL